MDHIFTLGTKLGELTNVNSTRGIGLLCLAINDAGKDSQRMSYQDFKEVFENQLKKRLAESNVANREKVVAELTGLLRQVQGVS